MPSELNALLLKFESIMYGDAIAPANKTPAALDILSAIDKLLRDPDYEIHRNCFDGVGNDARRAVISGFVLQMGTVLQAFSNVQQTAEMLGVKKPKGAKAPEHSQDPLGLAALGDALKGQKNERN